MVSVRWATVLVLRRRHCHHKLEEEMGNNTNRQGPHDGVRPPLTCVECNGTGRTDNHVTGEVECSGCEGTGVEERMEPSIEEMYDLIRSLNKRIEELESQTQQQANQETALRRSRSGVWA